MNLKKELIKHPLVWIASSMGVFWALAGGFGSKDTMPKSVPYTSNQLPQFKLKNDGSPQDHELEQMYDYWISHSPDQLLEQANMTSNTVGFILTPSYMVVVFLKENPTKHVGFAFFPLDVPLMQTTQELIDEFELTHGIL